MRIAIAGGSGFIGKHLVSYFTKNHHDIILISRSKRTNMNERIQSITWEELRATPNPLEGIDVIINLAGETINQRWTRTAKERILQSRLQTTAQIAQLVDRLPQKPQVVINASGMSIYGTSEEEVYDETSSPRIVDFLSGVVEKWEEAIDHIKGTRVIKLRVGLVLGNDGGAFPKMILPYRFGVGGRVGSGKQWISWIHIEDMVRLIDFCIQNNKIAGPVNATAPSPVTNDQFGRTVAKVLQKPHIFPVPAIMMKFMFGELSVLLLEGQRVLPKILLDHGFKFTYPNLEDAVRNLTEKQ